MWVGPLIACLSLAACLSVLELGLRLGGWAWARQRSGRPELFYRFSSRQDKDNINILAMGDSFTFGGTSLNDSSYPAILEKRFRLASASLRIEVTNSGICESTSRHVRDALENAISLNHPDILVLLTGAANRFDPVPYTEEVESLSTGVRRWMTHLRVYKVFRSLFWRVPDYALDKDPLSFHTGLIEETLGFARMSRSALSARRARLEEALKDERGPERGRRLVELAYVLAHLGLHAEAESVVRQAVAAKPISEDVRSRASFFFYKVAQRMTTDRAEKLRAFFEAARIAPRFYRSDRFYQDILKVYPFQSVYDAAAVLREFRLASEQHPGLRRVPLLQLHVHLFENLREWEFKRDEWLRRDLEEIIAKAAAKGVRLVLQTYPLPYSANAVIRESAARHGLPLVDNEPVFRALIAQNHGDRSPYIRNDDHCTDLGHELMAKEVQKVLEASVLPDAEKLRRHGSFPFLPLPGSEASRR